MLVHICCSVDSHYFLQEMIKKYPHEKYTAFFYNPNIHPEEEYRLRLLDVKRSCKALGVSLIVGDYDFMSWFDNVKGLENADEKGERCSVCFDVRLMKTALLALELGESKISTTLLASPMKDKEVLFNQGDKIADSYGLSFIKIDVRSDGGTQRQSKLAKEANLYRQNYCGCEYALQKQRLRANKICIELFNNIGAQIEPASTKETIETFLQIGELEKDDKPYILHKNSTNAYRLLHATLKRNGVVIPSYIFTHSKSCKKLKSNRVQWQKIHHNNREIMLGFCDNMLFIDIESINIALAKDYKNVTQMVFNPPKYDDEIRFRNEILGSASIKPFVVIDDEIDDGFVLNIESVFQNVDRFEVVKF